MTGTDTQAPNIADFPLPSDGWAALTDRVIVRVSGPGTDKFLQGQLSQNLNEVTAGHAPRATASTPKGRAYCLTRTIRAGEDILMDFPSELADDTINHLRKYLMLFRGTSMDPLPSAGMVGI
ncbi:MAG: folate-binding protein, partial [Marinobacter sp.]|nr:folate-binding protein [Marinobacter sp.]